MGKEESREEGGGEREGVGQMIEPVVNYSVPSGIAFNVEVALTQARMARRKTDALSTNMPSSQFADEQDEIEKHLASVIEQLTEIDVKIKKEGAR